MLDDVDQKMLSSLSITLFGAWMKLPYQWRRRIVISITLWVAIRIAAMSLGFEAMVFWLAAGLTLAFILAEVGIRKAHSAESWLYGVLSGQFQSLIVGAFVPVAIEFWARYLASQSQDELITAAIVTALFGYLVLFMRKSFNSLFLSKVGSRRQVTA